MKLATIAFALVFSLGSVQAQTTLDQLKSMQQAHNQILEAAYKTAGIDPSTIQEIRISKDGTVDCACLPPTVPINGAPAVVPAPDAAPEEPKNTAPTS